MTGGAALLETLVRAGVTDIFGLPGGANLPIYDALPAFERAGVLKHHLVGHEQGAAHAAEGYARATGKLGVCFATSGPGATNLITGLQDAKSDSTPILAITGQVPTFLLGTDAFQETDIVGATRPCTKHNYLVSKSEDLVRTVQEAIYLATTGRPGPVLVDVPKDVSAAVITPRWFPAEEIAVGLPGYVPNLEQNLTGLDHALALLHGAHRPVIYAGGGIIAANAAHELYTFASTTHIPVITTFMALDSFPAQHELAFRAPGMHGSIAANYALNTADCILALGARFDDRVTGKMSEFAQRAKIIHVDIDAAELNKLKRVEVALQNDARTALAALIDETAKHPLDFQKTHAWREQVQEWKEGWPFTYEERAGYIAPQRAIVELSRLTQNGDAIITTGVGQHQMWVTQFYHFSKPRTFISSLGLGTMGYGLPAAIGAQIARPDAQVIDVDGDGSFLMTLEELVVVGREQLPIKMLILDNQHLGMVAQWQRDFYSQNYSGVSVSHSSGTGKNGSARQTRYPDFTTIAAGFGIPGERIGDPEQLVPALQRMLAHDGPYLLHLDVDPHAAVYPIIGPGKSWKDITYPFKPLPEIPVHAR